MVQQGWCEAEAASPVTAAMPSPHEEGGKTCSHLTPLLQFYSFYLLGDNGSTNWTASQRDNLCPQLQSHLLSLAAKTSIKYIRVDGGI